MQADCQPVADAKVPTYAVTAEYGTAAAAVQALTALRSNMTAFVLRSSLGCGGEVLTASRTAVQLYSCAGGFGAGTQISALCCPPPPPLPPSPPAPQSPFPQAPATPRPPRQPRSPRPPPNTPPVAPPSPPAPPPPLGLGSLVPDPGGQQPPTPSQGIRDQQEQGDVSPAPAGVVTAGGGGGSPTPVAPIVAASVVPTVVLAAAAAGLYVWNRRRHVEQRMFALVGPEP